MKYTGIEKYVNSFAANMKSLRERKGLSQAQMVKDFSEFCGRDPAYSPSTVGAWENGRNMPQLAVFMKLMEYYGVSAGFLCGMDGRGKLDEK